MKSIDKFYDFGLEAGLAGFWLLGILSHQDFPIKYAIFFIISGLIVLSTNSIFFKLSFIMQPSLILAFLLVFSLVSNPKLTLFGGMIQCSYILLFFGVLLLILIKWKSNTLNFSDSLPIKSLLISGLSLASIGALLFIVFGTVYDLEINILISLIKNLAAYFLVGLLSYQATIDKMRCFRFGIVMIISSIIIILL